MAGRGVHFALTGAQAKMFLATKSDRNLLSLVSDIEEAWDEQFTCETDSAWDAIHRCLTDGSLLYKSGEYPLNHCICGGRQLFRGPGYTVSFVSAPKVKDVALALDKISKRCMRGRYDRLNPDEYDEVDICDDDFDYTWDNFLDLRQFYKRAAKAGRAVIFTVDCWPSACLPANGYFPSNSSSRLDRLNHKFGKLRALRHSAGPLVHLPLPQGVADRPRRLAKLIQ
jgi:hypothetical protein